ncbi:MAG: aminomethyl-transferring glycine dehydrogenase subunit GcvPA [Actinobacteria bacterium]|nr:aminomethyl-transferring glycine dehydrogenase subunit GcvPA [Actinomycetota bacterium]
MANSTPEAKERMLEATGFDSIDDLFAQIPADHRLTGRLGLPAGGRSEAAVRRRLLDALAKNETCEENLSFIGGGCWQHYVPAVCDEIVSRTEFVTSHLGTPASDYGRFHVWFEFASQLGELLDLDFVGLPVYSYGCAAGHAIRMAARLTDRNQVLLPACIDPERLAVIRNYCEPPEMEGHIEIVTVEFDRETGEIDLRDLEEKLSERTAAVYFENPSYLGTIESAGAAIGAAARAVGAETIVGVDPISLGVLAPPGRYGADIVVGTLQTLGVHMNCGGGVGGFIASRDEERYAYEYPTIAITACETTEPGELAFAPTLVEQTSAMTREGAKDWYGNNSVRLWTVANAVYMSLLGPRGFAEIGESIVRRGSYAAGRIGELPGVEIRPGGAFFKDFVVDFEGTGRTVDEINAGLRERAIFGGRSLSSTFPELGQSALYAVTEIHTIEDIDRLVDGLTEVTR